MITVFNNSDLIIGHTSNYDKVYNHFVSFAKSNYPWLLALPDTRLKGILYNLSIAHAVSEWSSYNLNDSNTKRLLVSAWYDEIDGFELSMVILRNDVRTIRRNLLQPISAN